MYLAYIDDSGRRAKAISIHVLASVLVHESFFVSLDVSAANAIYKEIPEDKLDEFMGKFTEFHASELYGGYGPFDSSIVSQHVRFGVIKHLLMLLEYHKVKVVYGGVNKTALQQTPYASANVVDMCFRICAEGIESYIERIPRPPTYEWALFIADEMNKDKSVLKSSFRELRKHETKPPRTALGRIWHVHDEIYFGESKGSIGIQLADLCAYFIAKHLEGGDDPAAEGFYKMIESHIVACGVEP